MSHRNFHFIMGDIRSTTLADEFFDGAYAISTIEHIGIGGRYGIKKEGLDGDVTACREIRRILRPEGVFLLTVPYGVWSVDRPPGRTYDHYHLDRLLEGWEIKPREFWAVNAEGYWQEAPEDEVAKVENHDEGLCLLELAKPAIS